MTVFDECGTDKGTHGYAPFYTSLPAPRRLLEVGVWQGHSLLAWRQLWPECEVVGIDSDLSPLEPRCLDDPHLAVMESDWRDFIGEGTFDLIVDDASHIPDQQIGAYRRLFPLLSPGGTYVIEDVADTSIADELGGRLERTGAGFDDCLLVLGGVR